MGTYEDGFIAGWRARESEVYRGRKEAPKLDVPNFFMSQLRNPKVASKTKRKVPQKGKAKVLTSMTKPIWDKYKKGSGKKTYVTIRAQVSRSQAYKKKVKGMK